MGGRLADVKSFARLLSKEEGETVKLREVEKVFHLYGWKKYASPTSLGFRYRYVSSAGSEVLLEDFSDGEFSLYTQEGEFSSIHQLDEFLSLTTPRYRLGSVPLEDVAYVRRQNDALWITFLEAHPVTDVKKGEPSAYRVQGVKKKIFVGPHELVYIRFKD